MDSFRKCIRTMARSRRVSEMVNALCLIVFLTKFYIVILKRRFPIVSGFRVKWDSRKPKGNRVLSIALLHGGRDDRSDNSGDTDEVEEPVENKSKEEGGRTYNVVTRLYMAQGFDGYDALKSGKYLVDEENGRIMSDLVRHFLLGEWLLLLVPNHWYPD